MLDVFELFTLGFSQGMFYRCTDSASFHANLKMVPIAP